MRSRPRVLCASLAVVVFVAIVAGCTPAETPILPSQEPASLPAYPVGTIVDAGTLRLTLEPITINSRDATPHFGFSGLSVTPKAPDGSRYVDPTLVIDGYDDDRPPLRGFFAEYVLVAGGASIEPSTTAIDFQQFESGGSQVRYTARFVVPADSPDAVLEVTLRDAPAEKIRFRLW